MVFLILLFYLFPVVGQAAEDACEPTDGDCSLDADDDEVLWFSLASPESAVIRIFKAMNSSQTKVFIPIPNMDVVCGCFVSDREHVGVSSDSYLSKKMHEVVFEMVEKYPYSSNLWKTCLNYDEGRIWAEAERWLR